MEIIKNKAIDNQVFMRNIANMFVKSKPIKINHQNKAEASVPF